MGLACLNRCAYWLAACTLHAAGCLIKRPSRAAEPPAALLLACPWVPALQAVPAVQGGLNPAEKNAEARGIVRQGVTSDQRAGQRTSACRSSSSSSSSFPHAKQEGQQPTRAKAPMSSVHVGRMAAAHCSRSARCSTGSSGVASASRCLQAGHGQQDGPVEQAEGWPAPRAACADASSMSSARQCPAVPIHISASALPVRPNQPLPEHLRAQLLRLCHHGSQRVCTREPPAGGGRGRHPQGVHPTPHCLGAVHHSAH